MADEISNKTLAILVVAAIVVTLGGTMLVLRSGPTVTGLYTSSVQGTAQLNYTQIVSIGITDNLIDFQSGASEGSGCTMDSGVEGGAGTNSGCTGEWNYSLNDQFTFYNDGNINAKVTVKYAVSGDASAAWIGGTNPTAKYQSSDTGLTNAKCVSGEVASWTEITASALPICNNLTAAGQHTEELAFDMQVFVPEDAYVGAKTTTLTFEATVAP